MFIFCERSHAILLGWVSLRCSAGLNNRAVARKPKQLLIHARNAVPSSQVAYSRAGIAEWA